MALQPRLPIASTRFSRTYPKINGADAWRPHRISLGGVHVFPGRRDGHFELDRPFAEVAATPGHGAWKRTGERATAGLDATGNTWSGNFTFDVVAPNGATVFSGGGTHSATRIRPEPL